MTKFDEKELERILERPRPGGRLPWKLTVGPFVYDIKYQEEVLHADNDDLDGFLEPDKLRITISGDFTYPKHIEILFHEIRHALLRQLHDYEKLDDDESFVQKDAVLWLTFLLDNPELLKILLSYAEYRNGKC